jgi:hypothetical protein
LAVMALPPREKVKSRAHLYDNGRRLASERSSARLRCIPATNGSRSAMGHSETFAGHAFMPGKGCDADVRRRHVKIRGVPADQLALLL